MLERMTQKMVTKSDITAVQACVQKQGEQERERDDHKDGSRSRSCFSCQTRSQSVGIPIVP
eukprot:1126628-Pyramimonas_sp.AAC.1